MKPLNAVPKTAKILSIIVAAILLLLPFHAFLTIWLSSGLGHYTLWRLWKEALLVPVFVGTVYILAISPGLRRKLFASWLTRLIAIYTALLFICGFVALARHAVTGEALAYGLLVDLRFLIFFLMVLVIAACSSFLSRNWRALLLLPATLVIIFGLLQYWLLPYDFLKHFGYGPATISPYETINHNIHRLRIESTLRGANPLGAYLVLIISAALSLLTAAKAKRPSQYAWLGGALLALVFSYSRSAWIGTFLSAAIILWLALKTHRARKIALLAAGAVIIAGGVAALALRHNLAFEDAFLHTDDQSQAAQSSNQGHSTAFKNGARDILHQPLGGGAGTAGPASAYNNHPGRLAENYFLQIGQEAGVAGIALFIAINIIVGRLLWLKRAQPLALALLASLIGLTFVNMLSHAWTDDTLSYIWWGLAAISLSPGILEHKSNKNGKAQIRPKT